MVAAVRPAVSPEHSNEVEHRRELADAINELADSGPFHRITDAEISAGVILVDREFPELHVLRYGKNTTPGTTDMSGAINTAIAVAVAHSGVTTGNGGAEVILPPGTLRCESDVEMRDHVTLRGHYNGTLLEFNGCSLLLDATTAADDIFADHIVAWSFQNVRVRRIGTAGFAVRMITNGGSGAGDNRDVNRFSIQNLYIIDSTGGGFHINGAYLGAAYNTFIRNCSGVGLLIDQQPNTGGFNTALNAFAFFGGEIHAATKAAELDRLRGVAFYGMAFEGSTTGVEINIGSAITFDGCYFEANGNYDLSIGTDTGGAPNNLNVRGCIFNGSTNYAIDLQRVDQAVIEGCTFENYTIAGINRNGAASTTVTGVVRRCVASGTTPTVLANGNSAFNLAMEEMILAGTLTWNPGPIADGDQLTNAITVTGAATGDPVMSIAPSAGIGNLGISATATGADTVTVVLQNNTGASVDVANQTFRALVLPLSKFF